MIVDTVVALVCFIVGHFQEIIMRKNIQPLFLLLFIFSLIGCTTVQTRIDNMDDYAEIPIEVIHRYIVSDVYTLGNFGIEVSGSIKEFEGNAGRIVSREYTFREGNTQLSKHEIIQRETKGLFFSSIDRFIKFTDNTGRSVEYEVDFIAGSYVTIQDASLGKIEIKYYSTDGYHTGFDFLVNGERYGIIAFYPIPFKSGIIRPSFFLRRGNDLQRSMALYILTAYLSYQTRF